MTRHNAYWIFFVIIAVGLALSWGQVGRKTQRVFDESPVVYLSTEADCAPRRAPCAAMAGDRAIVLGPATPGLAVRQTGLDTSGIVRVEAVFLAADGAGVTSAELAADRDRWRVPRLPDGVALVRIRFVGNRESSIAEFPVAR